MSKPPIAPSKRPPDGNVTTFSFITTTPGRITGLSSYTDSIVSAYAARYPNQELLFITNAEASLFPSLANAKTVEVRKILQGKRLPFKLYNIVAHLAANIIAYRRGSKTYISTTPQASVVSIVPQAFVIHDMYDVDPHFRSRLHVIYTSIMLRCYTLVSRDIVCVSDSTREDAVSVLPRTADKMSVIKEASKYPPISAEEAFEAKRSGRILYVANIETTKNVECLLDALQLAERRGIDVHVDWIGRDPKGLVARWVAANGPLGNLHPMGVVDDATLAAAYRRSSALVVTSFREGFCLPVLEANAHGTPAIVSDIATLREIAGEAGAFFDPKRPDECLARMEEHLRHEAVEIRVRQAQALENARLFSWDKAAGDFGTIAERNARC